MDGLQLWAVQHKAKADPSVLNCPQTDVENDHPILRKEMEAAEHSLKKEKSSGVDSIPAELLQEDGEDVITILMTICNKIWQIRKLPTPWTQSLVITLPTRSNLHHRTDLQLKNPLWEISPAPARHLPCLHKLQDGLWQDSTCSFVGNHEGVQHQRQPYPSHQTHLWQGHWCSLL